LGRDIKSVFPTESKRAVLESDAAKAILEQGSKKFITESELAEITAASRRRDGVGDGDEAPSKPLAQILLDQRAEKEARFQEQWKQMKIGKNRPLDEDELQFLDSFWKAETEEVKRRAQEEQIEIEEFQKLRNKMLNSNVVEENRSKIVTREGSGRVLHHQAPPPTSTRTSKPRLLVKPKPFHPPAEEEVHLESHKRAKMEPAAPQGGQERTNGLCGLLGDYGSDSEEQLKG
jgi:hypothetical protein